MKREYVYSVSAVVMWGTMAAVVKLLIGNRDSFYVLFFTCLFATLILLVFSILNGSIRELRSLSGKTLLKMTLIGSLGVFFYNLFFFMGTAILPAQQAMVVNDLWPALILVFSCIILKEKLTAGKIIAVVMSFLGILIVVTDGNLSGFRNLKFAGVLFCLLDAVCYALYSVLGKRETYNKDLSVLVAYATATIASFFCMLIKGFSGMPDGREMAGLLYNGAICNAIPYLLWVKALDMGNTAVIANMAYLTPFVSLVVTHYVLGEKITFYSVLGLVLIISGILIQIRMSKKEG